MYPVAIFREWFPYFPVETHFDRWHNRHGWMRFAHLDGSVYYYNTNRRIVTPDDITQPEILQKYRTYANNVMRRLAMHPAYTEHASDWQTLVIKDLASATLPTAFVLNYARGTYAKLRATAPEDEPARKSH